MKRHYAEIKLTERCNFSCHYCFQLSKRTDQLKDIDFEHLANFINKLENWELCLTGGEPLLHPNFIQLAKLIVEKNYLSINTNLSHPSIVDDIITHITPDRVHDIFVSSHFLERKKRKLEKQLIVDMMRLKESGFPVRANFVLHPELFDDFLTLFAQFSQLGLTLFPKPFKGICQGKEYPHAYTDEERKVFQQHKGSYHFQKRQVFSFKGNPCGAGTRLLSIEPDGSIHRCPTIKKSIGHIANDLFLLPENLPCTADQCFCFGSDYIELSDDLSSLFEGTKHIVDGKYSTAKEYLETAYKINRIHPSIRNNLIYLYHRQKKFLSASLIAKKAILPSTVLNLSFQIDKT